MESSKEILWTVEAIVEPKVEWEKIGIDNFEFEANESITLENQFEDKTQFSVSIIAEEEKVHDRAELLMMSFLALLGLEARRCYKYKIGHMRPVQPVRSKDGWTFLDSMRVSCSVFTPFESLNFSYLKGANSLLKGLDKEKRDVMLEALHFLHDAINAATAMHSYLSIYGGLCYLSNKIGRKEYSKDSAKETLSMFRDNGVLNDNEITEWFREFINIHNEQYGVIKSNKVKYEKLQEIRAYFKKFFIKCMEYYGTIA